MPKHVVIEKYEALKKEFWKDQTSAATELAITETLNASVALLQAAQQVPLVSEIAGKNFFQFRHPNGPFHPSRAVNQGLFGQAPMTNIVGDWVDLIAAIKGKNLPSAEEINRTIYRAVMAFCCSADGITKNDKQRPGTYFSYIVAFLFCLVSGQKPTKQVQVLQLLEEKQKGSLPTDFLFDMGVGKPKFHVPVKTSTRERIVQIFAHHAILNRTYGNRSFLATAFVIGETKKSEDTSKVTEICIVNQIQVFQERLEVIDRFYYLDPPLAYLGLNSHATIRFKTFGDFFHEFDALVDA